MNSNKNKGSQIKKGLLSGFFALLLLFNFFAPVFVTHHLAQRQVVFAQGETPAETEGTEEVMGSLSCYDGSKEETGLWDTIQDAAWNPAVVIGTGGVSGAVGAGSWFAKKAGGVIDFAKNPMKWFVCGVSGLLTSAIDFLNLMMNRLMLFDPTKTEDEADTAYSEDCKEGTTSDPNCAMMTGLSPEGVDNLKIIWRSILNVSNILLILAFLVMVISTALDLGIFNAYTIKKMLPRIIIAALAANLSWIICSVTITGINYIGIGVQSVLISPFTDGLANTLDEVGQAVTGEAVNEGGVAFQGPVMIGIGAVIFTIFASGGAILLPLLAFVLVAILVGFLVFLVRRILLLMLVMIAPLAFMAWALPGGDSWLKKWWKSFTQLLLIYPYAMTLLGSGIVIASVIGQTGGDSAIEQVLNSFLMIIALVLPYMVLPTAFKMIGGTLGTITGKLNDRSKGLIDRANNAKDNSAWGLRKKRKDEIRSAKKQRNMQEGLNGDGILARGRRRQAYGGAGLNPWKREANKDFTGALMAQQSDKYEKEQREIQRTKFDQEHKTSTNDQKLAAAEVLATTGTTKAERLAGKDFLVDMKAEKELSRVQEHHRAAGGELANEWDQFSSDRFGDIKPFAVHLATETRNGDGSVRSQSQLAQAQVEALAGAGDEVKATQKASGVQRMIAMDDSGKIASDYGRIAANDNLNGKLDTKINDAIAAGKAGNADRKDLFDAVRMGVAAAPGANPITGSTSNDTLANASQKLETSIQGLREDHRSASTRGQPTGSIEAQISVNEQSLNEVNAEIQRRNNLPPPPPGA